MIHIPISESYCGPSVSIAGWVGEIVESVPHSDFLWSLTLAGTHADGDAFTAEIILPADIEIEVF